MDFSALSAAGIGVVVGLVTAYVALRRDGRETRQQAMSEAKDTIDLLREQTEILKAHGKKREVEWHRIEQSWHRREEKLESRIGDLERDYRSLVLTITTMGLCANAATCPNYNAGDRRTNKRPFAAEGDTG